MHNEKKTDRNMDEVYKNIFQTLDHINKLLKSIEGKVDRCINTLNKD